ncbi:MAG: DUF4198 domain-containing protein, partial [Bacteroidota bacterium]
GFAHYMWIETQGTGQLGKVHEVKVFFGEYTYGVIEDPSGDAFKNVADFGLWVLGPDGSKTLLKPVAKTDHYLARFTPEKEGTYTVVLNNDTIGVLDYTQYDFGIFKPQYRATARIQVGSTIAPTASEPSQGLLIRQLEQDNGQIGLQVLYQGKPLPQNELKVYLPELWSKTLETDAEGMVYFSLPWPSTYTVETTYNETVPGSYRGKDYEFIWHCATYALLNR